MLVIKQGDSNAAKNGERITQILCRLGISVLPADTMEQADFVTVVGGDGTIMHTAKQAALYNKPVLGINSGRVGFLAGLEPDEGELLSLMTNGGYDIDRRMLLQVTYKIGGRAHTCYALNEVAVTRSGPARMMDITLKESIHQCELHYRADGLLAATPTGSTAYSLSAGGPVLDPAIEGIVVTPLCPFSLHTRSLVFSTAHRLSVTAECPMGGQIFLCVDGEEPVDITGQEITIEKAQLSVGLIRLKQESFFDRYKNKIMDRSYEK